MAVSSAHGRSFDSNGTSNYLSGDKKLDSNEAVLRKRILPNERFII